MTDDDDPDAAAAAEYVLGTLPAEERFEFARRLDLEPGLREVVRAWERRLAPLAATVPSVEPPERVWQAVEAGTRAGTSVGEVVFFSAEVARLRRSRTAWQGATAAAGALAATLGLWIAVDARTPAVVPRSLVAVVNRAGDLPALLVRVDPREGTVRIRALTAETPVGHSLELWSIVGSEAPRSLGTLAGDRRAAIPAADRGRLENATLAVTVEPAGGSSTGKPTGPVVYSGKLVPDPE